MITHSCIIPALAWAILGSLGPAQVRPEITQLFAELNRPSTTDRAARQILETTAGDPDGRRYIAERLPEMIDKPQTDKIWRNAINLAGQLRADQAVPSLIKALRRGPVGPSVTTLTMQERMDNDIVGKALSMIGGSAVPPLADLLAHGALKDRRRSAWILLHIDAPSARKALLDHLQHETDPQIKNWIRRRLHQS